MKNLFIKSSVAAMAAISMMMTACGDDSSTSGNVDRDEDSSSSAVEESSSFVEDVSSSSEEDDGTRAAKLSDLEKNYSLGEMFGTTVYLATGAKKGVFSLWAQEEGTEVAWVGIRSDFKDGVLEFSKELKNSAPMGVAGPILDSLSAMVDKGTSIKIIVDEDESLQFSLNGGDYKKLEPVKVRPSTNYLSSGEDLVGHVVKCTAGESKKTYSFYDGRYVVESDSDWDAGYFDIQRNRLLMLPTFYKKSASSLTVLSVDSKFSLYDVNGNDMKCSSSELKWEEIDAEKMAGEWVSGEGGYDWTLTLKSTGAYSLDAKKGFNSELNNNGVWDVYGDVLLIKNKACTAPKNCLSGIKGVVSGFDPKKGFKYEHSNTETPDMPTQWELPVYE